MFRRHLVNDLFLSELTFGTMRFKFNNDSDADELLKQAINLGITTFHTSFEYETHKYFSDRFAEVKKNYPSIDFQHIVKLGEPHFDSKIFSQARFEKIIDDQLLALNTERIDIVQWLLRHTPNKDNLRIKVFEESSSLFTEIVLKLKQKGKIRSIGSHPYSKKFAERISDLEEIESWITYLNVIELEWLKLQTKPFIAIRPLAAGKLLKNTKIWQFLNKHEFFNSQTKLESLCLYPLLNPNVKSLILSIKNTNNLYSLNDVFSKTYSDLDMFNQITDFLKNEKNIKINEEID